MYCINFVFGIQGSDSSCFDIKRQKGRKETEFFLNMYWATHRKGVSAWLISRTYKTTCTAPASVGLVFGWMGRLFEYNPLHQKVKCDIHCVFQYGAHFEQFWFEAQKWASASYRVRTLLSFWNSVTFSMSSPSWKSSFILGMFLLFSSQTNPIYFALFYKHHFPWLSMTHT